jgi:hypothetical protein
MPTDISTTAADSFNAVVTAPANGDPRTSASVSVMGQALTNRSLWNWKRVQAMLGKYAPVSTDLPIAVENVDLATDTITLTAHGFANGDQVRFDGSGTAPLPAVIGTMYYVVGATSNTFQLALTLGGAVLNLTGALVGRVYAIKIIAPNIFLPDAAPILGGRLDTILAMFALKDFTNIFTGTNSFAGATLFQPAGQIITAGMLTFLGNSARIIHRAPIAVSGAADSTINMANSDHFTVGTLTADRVYLLNETTLTAPISYERKRFTIPTTNGHAIVFRREGSATGIFSYAGAATALSCEMWYDGAHWRGGSFSGAIVPGVDY